MLNHLSLGVGDIAASKRFYDSVLQPLGYRCLSQDPDALGYGQTQAAFWLLRVAAQPVAPRPGLHVGFDAPTRSSVEAFYAAALASGGRDNGPPGLRPEYAADYYAAFVIDPDGYRLEAYCAS